jgi:hypothetical protein
VFDGEADWKWGIKKFFYRVYIMKRVYIYQNEEQKYQKNVV